MKLIILNGPPGVGKSTIATRLHEKLPSSVLIDVDELRRTIPDYKEKRQESLLLSYEMTKDAVEENLKNGHDVIIDKAVSQSDTLNSLIEAGRRNGAEVHEFILFADKTTVRKRADERGYKPGSLLTPQRVDELWEKANELVGQRSSATIIDTSNLAVDEVFNKVRELL